MYRSYKLLKIVRFLGLPCTYDHKCDSDTTTRISSISSQDCRFVTHIFDITEGLSIKTEKKNDKYWRMVVLVSVADYKIHRVLVSIGELTAVWKWLLWPCAWQLWVRIMMTTRQHPSSFLAFC